MILFIFSNSQRPEYGQATVSFPIREEEYPSVVSMLQRMGLGDPLERDCWVDEVNGDWPILMRLEKVAINLDEMDISPRDWLALTRRKRQSFRQPRSDLDSSI